MHATLCIYIWFIWYNVCTHNIVMCIDHYFIYIPISEWTGVSMFLDCLLKRSPPASAAFSNLWRIRHRHFVLFVGKQTCPAQSWRKMGNISVRSVPSVFPFLLAWCHKGACEKVWCTHTQSIYNTLLWTSTRFAGKLTSKAFLLKKHIWAFGALQLFVS